MRRIGCGGRCLRSLAASRRGRVRAVRCRVFVEGRASKAGVEGGRRGRASKAGVEGGRRKRASKAGVEGGSSGAVQWVRGARGFERGRRRLLVRRSRAAPLRASRRMRRVGSRRPALRPVLPRRPRPRPMSAALFAHPRALNRSPGPIHRDLLRQRPARRQRPRSNPLTPRTQVKSSIGPRAGQQMTIGLTVMFFACPCGPYGVTPRRRS